MRLLTTRLLCWVGIAALSWGCAKSSSNVQPAISPAKDVTGVLRMPVTFASDAHDLSSWDAFEKNLFVGDIWLGGGYEFHPNHANQARSVEVNLENEQETRQVLSQWLTQTIDTILAEHQLVVIPSDASLTEAFRPPIWSPLRGSGELDGHDNQNLPRFQLQPQPLQVDALPELDGATAHLLVPLVAHYYSHSGGWFIGQNDGCEAGARIRILWLLYDKKTGQLATWGDVSERHIQERMYSPSRAQREDYLMMVEAKVSEQLTKQIQAGILVK